MCGPHQVWPLRSECCGRGVPTKVVCAECMKMCCLGGKNSVVKGLRSTCTQKSVCQPPQKFWGGLYLDLCKCGIGPAQSRMAGKQATDLASCSVEENCMEYSCVGLEKQLQSDGTKLNNTTSDIICSVDLLATRNLVTGPYL